MQFQIILIHRGHINLIYDCGLVFMVFRHILVVSSHGNNCRLKAKILIRYHYWYSWWNLIRLQEEKYPLQRSPGDDGWSIMCCYIATVWEAVIQMGLREVVNQEGDRIAIIWFNMIGNAFCPFIFTAFIHVAYGIWPSESRSSRAPVAAHVGWGVELSLSAGCDRHKVKRYGNRFECNYPALGIFIS